MQVLEAAQRLFYAEGIDSVSVDQVAQAAGVWYWDGHILEGSPRVAMPPR